MSLYTKCRELIVRADALEAEALNTSGRARADRLLEAAECRTQAEWLSGRIGDGEYMDALCEQTDARHALAVGAEEQGARDTPLPVCDNEIPW